VLHTISQSLDLSETFQEITMSAVRTVSGSNCLLLELSAETGDLVTVAASESDASSLIGLRLRFASGQSLATLLQGRRSIVVDDLIAGAGVDAEAKRLLNLRSALIVPVLAQGELIGSLVLYSVGRRTRYSEQDMARAGEVADQAAIAIANARLYRDLGRSRESIKSLAQRICEIRQDERQTFASVVHDDIIQSVVGARYLLESFLRLHPDASAEILDEVVGVLHQAVDDARRVVWELRPPVLDELGLEASLAALGRHLGNARGTTLVDTDICHIPSLSRETATAVYKVAREATLNASRHARAHHIWISLVEIDSGGTRSARLSVRDDGAGFDVSTLNNEEHFGCAMMEEQATVIGAALSLESSPGAGTVVALDIPLNG
jgi:signal transduction histidine kinase